MLIVQSPFGNTPVSIQEYAPDPVVVSDELLT